MSTARIELLEHQLRCPDCLCAVGRSEAPSSLYPCVRCGVDFELTSSDLCPECEKGVDRRPLSRVEQVRRDTHQTERDIAQLKAALLPD